MSSPPELIKQYERLLWAYPAAYRRERGDELLDTLMESAEDGQTRPSRREAVALVVGGLRARAGRDRRQSVRLTWLAGLRAAALMLLVMGVGNPALWMVVDAARGFPSFYPWQQIVPLTIGVVAVVLALLRRYVWAIVVALIGFGAAQAVVWDRHFPNMWELLLAAVLMIPLVRSSPVRVTGLLRWAPVVPPVMIAADWLAPVIWPERSGLLSRAAYFAFIAAALAWVVIDERVAMAMGFLLLSSTVTLCFYLVRGFEQIALLPGLTALATALLPSAVLLVASGLRSRRSARL